MQKQNSLMLFAALVVAAVAVWLTLRSKKAFAADGTAAESDVTQGAGAFGGGGGGGGGGSWSGGASWGVGPDTAGGPLPTPSPIASPIARAFAGANAAIRDAKAQQSFETEQRGGQLLDSLAPPSEPIRDVARPTYDLSDPVVAAERAVTSGPGAFGIAPSAPSYDSALAAELAVTKGPGAFGGAAPPAMVLARAPKSKGPRMWVGGAPLSKAPPSFAPPSTPKPFAAPKSKAPRMLIGGGPVTARSFKPAPKPAPKPAGWAATASASKRTIAASKPAAAPKRPAPRPVFGMAQR